MSKEVFPLSMLEERTTISRDSIVMVATTATGHLRCDVLDI